MSAACADIAQPAAINATTPKRNLLITNSPRHCRDPKLARAEAVAQCEPHGYEIPLFVDKIYREF
jgi:hypothetical protein